MILHWLAGYSIGSLITIAGGLLVSGVMGFHLVRGQKGKVQYPIIVTTFGMLGGLCQTGSSLLRGKASWDDAGDIIGMIGDVMLIVWGVQTLRLYMGQCNKTAVPTSQGKS